LLLKRNTQSERLKEYILTHQSDFYRLAFSYTKNREDALDVVQESVYKALSNASKLKKPEFLKTWLYRIIINESLNHLKRQKKVMVNDDLLENITYEDKDISESITVYQAVEQLEPMLRTVIILRFYEDMKLDEIAQVTKSNLSTTKTRLYRGLEILKELIGSDEIA